MYCSYNHNKTRQHTLLNLLQFFVLILLFYFLISSKWNQYFSYLCLEFFFREQYHKNSGFFCSKTLLKTISKFVFEFSIEFFKKALYLTDDVCFLAFKFYKTGKQELWFNFLIYRDYVKIFFGKSNCLFSQV